MLNTTKSLRIHKHLELGLLACLFVDTMMCYLMCVWFTLKDTHTSYKINIEI